MKLYCHPISPFARKAMILARLGRVAVTEITPEKDGANGYAVVGNPLGKMPSLVLREGQSLFDSRVICEFLDGLSAAPLCPASGDARFTQLRQHALGDGLSEAVYNLRMETLRPSALHWDDIIERHETAIHNVVMGLAEDVANLGDSWTFGNLSIICALDYADYRAGHLDWRSLSPALSAWHAGFKTDPIYRDTYGYGAFS